MSYHKLSHKLELKENGFMIITKLISTTSRTVKTESWSVEIYIFLELAESKWSLKPGDLNILGSLLCLRSPQLCEIAQVTSLKLSKPSFKSHQLTNISFDIIIEAGNTHTHTWSIIKQWIFIQHVVNMGCAQVALFLRSYKSSLKKN